MALCVHLKAHRHYKMCWPRAKVLAIWVIWHLFISFCFVFFVWRLLAYVSSNLFISTHSYCFHLQVLIPSWSSWKASWFCQRDGRLDCCKFKVSLHILSIHQNLTGSIWTSMLLLVNPIALARTKLLKAWTVTFMTATFMSNLHILYVLTSYFQFPVLELGRPLSCKYSSHCIFVPSFKTNLLSSCRINRW